MRTPAPNRETRILDLLKKKGSASIDELAEACSVSRMTIHRDLNRLEELGRIRKRHGSASLAGMETEENSCAMCGKSTVRKKVFIIYLAGGEQQSTCCAHCGLMLLSVTKGAWQSMTMDFLHGHMISANQAIYLIDCDLIVCCVPTILTFGSSPEAERFQRGFGGKLASMDKAIQFLLGGKQDDSREQK